MRFTRHSGARQRVGALRRPMTGSARTRNPEIVGARFRVHRYAMPRNDGVSPLRAQFRPVEFFLELMKGVVADRFGLALPENRAACRADGAPPQRIGREFAAANAAIGVALGAQQQRAIFKPE